MRIEMDLPNGFDAQLHAEPFEATHLTFVWVEVDEHTGKIAHLLGEDANGTEYVMHQHGDVDQYEAPKALWSAAEALLTKILTETVMGGAPVAYPASYNPNAIKVNDPEGNVLWEITFSADRREMKIRTYGHEGMTIAPEVSNGIRVFAHGVA